MKKRKILLLWLPVIIWMIVIFCFSAQVSSESSETSGPFAKLLAKIIWHNFESYSVDYKDVLINKCQFAVRKAAHFTIYAILGFLCQIGFTSFKQLNGKLKIVLSAAFCLLYAVSDEIHQHFVPGRSCQLRDVIIDFSGALLGIFLFTLLIFTVRKMRNRTK